MKLFHIYNVLLHFAKALKKTTNTPFKKITLFSQNSFLFTNLQDLYNFNGFQAFRYHDCKTIFCLTIGYGKWLFSIEHDVEKIVQFIAELAAYFLIK